jgi:hypothetical protein
MAQYEEQNELTDLFCCFLRAEVQGKACSCNPVAGAIVEEPPLRIILPVYNFM